MADTKPTDPGTPIVIRWAYQTVNAIFLGVTLIMICFCIMEALGTHTVNTGAAWLFAYATGFGLVLAVILFALLLIHAVNERTTALLKRPFMLLVLMILTMGVRILVIDR